MLNEKLGNIEKVLDGMLDSLEIGGDDYNSLLGMTRTLILDRESRGKKFQRNTLRGKLINAQWSFELIVSEHKERLLIVNDIDDTRIALLERKSKCGFQALNVWDADLITDQNIRSVLGMDDQISEDERGVLLDIVLLIGFYVKAKESKE